MDSGHRDYETRSVLYRIFYDEFMMTIYDIGKVFGVSYRTVHKALQVLEPQQYNTVQRDIYRQLTKRIIKHVEDKDEKSFSVQCSNKKDDDSLNLIFFADRDSCTVWNEKDIARKAFEESNSYQISSIRNSLKNFQYLYTTSQLYRFQN